MAHESFESEEAAAILNKYFISIKVDREERPDVDAVYMEVCQGMTGSGGWPLTVIMTPDKKPFYAATYLPLHTMYGRMGLVELLSKLAALWKKDRKVLLTQSDKIVKHFTKAQDKGEAADISELLEAGYHDLSVMYEPKHGGFSHAPKFPMPHYMLFLLADWRANGRAESLDMVSQTLVHMYRGGIFDHVGGGFARYSTDERWLVPHFEKMLYDNALLLQAYAKGYAATQTELFRFVAQNIADYLMNDMQTALGGYCSAEDADSEGEEGKFYVWHYDELKDALSADELLRLEGRYGLKPKGNFEGRSIINRINVPGMADEADLALLRKLYDIRKKRIPPFKDTKISAAWNGLAIEAMAIAGMALDNNACIRSAEKAADFILQNMTKGDRLACGTYMDSPGGPAFLADYANMINALIALYTATRKLEYIEKATAFASSMLRLFQDDKGFSMSSAGSEGLFMRPLDEYDGAMPSGSSCAVMALIRLYHITGETNWRSEADTSISKLLPQATASPASHIHLLSAVMLLEKPHRQIVISAAADNAEAAKSYETLQKRYDPFTTVIWYDRSVHMDALMPHAAAYKTDAPFAGYVCENFACKQPEFSAQELLESVMA